MQEHGPAQSYGIRHCCAYELSAPQAAEALEDVPGVQGHFPPELRAAN
jgi:hypothetical protein